MIRRNI